MIDNNSCLFASLLLGGMFWLHMSAPTKSINFEQSLDTKQLIAYKMIQKQRMMIALRGLVLGLLLAILYMAMYGKNMESRTTKWCLFASIVMGTQYFYYMLSPKPPLLVNYLTSPTQIMNWNNIGNHMQKNYHFGMLLGLAGFFFVARTFMNEPTYSF